MKGLIVKTTGLWYEALVNGERKIARLRGKFKLEGKKITNPIAVGDEVILEPLDSKSEWVITDILSRKNYLTRQSPRKKGHAHLIASNLDQTMILFTFRDPRTSIGFLDRILVTLETFRIPAIIVLNKTDLYSAEELQQWNDISELYKTLGYRTAQASLISGEVNLQSLLAEKSTLLVGHSGTGKSTLINKLVPNADQQIGEISNFANKGVHTTTFAEMFIIDEVTKIVDTPGIKEFGLAEIEAAELAHYFPEMRAHLGQCKFHNCIHFEEPGCIIKEKIEQGEISMSRYGSYLSMLFPEENRR